MPPEELRVVLIVVEYLYRVNDVLHMIPEFMVRL
jgi:hypothetical protein